MRLDELQSFKDVAAFFGATEREFIKWVYRVPSYVRYRRFEIEKRSGGMRLIEAPSKRICRWQKELSRALASYWRPLKCVHGYRVDRSIVSNAEQHLNRAWVFNIDLAGYFPSCTFPRVLGLFRAYPLSLPQKAAAPLAHLATDGAHLPHGSPSSPVLANQLTARLDGDLLRLARRLRCTYTRYADDLTFSARRWPPPSELVVPQGGSQALPGIRLSSILADNGFTPNLQKSWIQRRGQRMIVTGLSVAGPSVGVPSRYRRRLRAAIDFVQRNGESDAQIRYQEKYAPPSRAPFKDSPPQVWRVLRGQLEFLRMVYGDGNPVYENFAHDYAAAFPARPPPPRVTRMKNVDVFICHSSEDKPAVVFPLRKALETLGVSCWLDSEQIRAGASIPLQVNDGLRRSRMLLAVVSRSFLTKQWTKTEMGSILHAEISSGRLYVVPLVVGGEAVFRRFSLDYPLVAHKKYIAWADPRTVASEIHGTLPHIGESSP